MGVTPICAHVPNLSTLSPKKIWDHEDHEDRFRFENGQVKNI
jgi:hypothetical protein